MCFINVSIFYHIFTSVEQEHLHVKGHPKGPTSLKSGKKLGTQLVKLLLRPLQKELSVLHKRRYERSFSSKLLLRPPSIAFLSSAPRFLASILPSFHPSIPQSKAPRSFLPSVPLFKSLKLWIICKFLAAAESSLGTLKPQKISHLLAERPQSWFRPISESSSSHRISWRSCEDARPVRLII